MQKKQILLINDLAGYGKVATAAMLPILSYMGHPVYNLPTALVSNTLDYGKFNILDTTDYIKGVFPVWKQLGFRFDAIATGFIVSVRQAEIISEYCREQANNGTLIFVDPIMGDEGKLYNGVTMETVKSMREMIRVAHLIVPNYTEACFLTDTTHHAESVTRDEAYELLDKLRKLGTKSALISSMKVDEIPVHFPGTGDMFSAILYAHLLDGEPLRLSTRIAMDVLYRLIEVNKDNSDKNRGVPVENWLHLIRASF